VRRWMAGAAAVLLAAGMAASAEAWRTASPGYRWSFPADHWPHRDYRTEWWYLTGDLRAHDDPTRVFGYQFTLFRIGVRRERSPLRSAWAADTLILGHAAVTDVARSTHVFSDVLHRESPLLAALSLHPHPLIARLRAPAGTDAAWTLRWNGAGFDLAMRDDARGIAFDLATHPLRPVVLQGPNGLSLKSPTTGAASLYYSFTRMRTEGRLTVGGRTFAVRGTSWMDKEFSTSQLSPEQAGWDWFSLRLDDRRDLMLYVMRRAGGETDFRNATLVAADGRARSLPPGAWSVRATARWRSPSTDATYPARWTVQVPGEGIRLEVVPEVADQENRGRVPSSPYYWEGLVAVRDPEGRRRGRGYVELTGYGRGNRPPV
jgi:predicted secreted hydrolase